MSTPRSLDGLRRSTDKRRTTTRRKIKKALRDMQRKRLTINPNALAKYAGVARKTIYNHPDLLDDIKAAASTTPAPQLATLAQPPTAESSINAALREQLRIQKRRYETNINELKTEITQLNRDLAAAHGEIHRLRNTTNTATRQTR